MPRLLFASLLAALAVGCSGRPAPAPTPSPSAAPTRARVALQPQFNAGVEQLKQVMAAEQRWQSGDSAGALAALRAMEAQSAHSSDLSEQLARVYIERGRLDRGLAQAQQAARLAPKAATALLRLGQLEFQLGLLRDAGVHLRAAVSAAPDSVEPRMALAQLLQAEEQYREAENQWQEALALDRDNPALWSGLVSSSLRRSDFSAARLALKEVDRLAPGSPPALLQGADIARQEARGASGKRRRALYGDAERLAQSCLQIQPDAPLALALLGTVYEEQGRDSDALPLLERAYARMPDQPDLRVKLAQVLIRHGDRTRGLSLLAADERAARVAEQRRRLIAQVSAAPSDPAARRALARWCDAHGDPVRAAIEWSAVRKLLPNDPEARRARGS